MIEDIMNFIETIFSILLLLCVAVFVAFLPIVGSIFFIAMTVDIFNMMGRQSTILNFKNDMGGYCILFIAIICVTCNILYSYHLFTGKLDY